MATADNTPRHLRWLAWLIAATGKAVSWLTLAMVLLTFTVVVLRYGFNLGWIWMQDSVTYLHGAVFMLAAAWALQTDDHVRVDILYRGRSPRYQATVNLIGIAFFLIPVCLFLLWSAWDYVIISWTIREGAREAGGLPLVYLQKSLILLLPLLLLLQAVVSVGQAINTLRQRAA